MREVERKIRTQYQMERLLTTRQKDRPTHQICTHQTTKFDSQTLLQAVTRATITKKESQTLAKT